uniref:Holliday junction branch migration complex subunit RuvA n=1 Tax=Magnetococcus massalia (strain MO-1) TaxID=451514 RepID=A0A1S7LJJ4_MAGMO|nr:Holliday junction ATP-dependent DNA helicase ruvA [Candidatus Magnetococcus massalia]
MIAHLKGTVAAKHLDHVVLDVNGVGYRVFIPLSTYNNLPAIGEAYMLYTVTVVREDAFLLYGFQAEAEKSLFLLLTNVNGIGAKLALAALSTYSPEDLTGAIRAEEIGLLSRIPGVGKKTAQRLAMELKEKVGSLPTRMPTGGGEVITAPAPTPTGLREEIASALLNLGYKRPQVDAALAKVFQNEVSDLAEGLKATLKILAPKS